MDDGLSGCGARRGLIGLLTVISVLAVCAFCCSSALAASNVEISGSMEGAITVSNGDYVSAGYIFNVQGSHPEEHVFFEEARFTIQGTCSNGSSENTLSFSLAEPAGGWLVPANSGESIPTGNEQSPKSFEGDTVAHVCGGGSATLNASKGGTFTAHLAATAPNSVQIKMHYRDPNAKGKGNVNCAAESSEGLGADVCGASWSGTPTVTPATPEPEPPVPAFTPEKLQRISPAAAYQTGKLSGKAPLTVEYEIAVTNTSKATVTIESISDAKVPTCDTNAPKQREVKAGEKDVVESTCSHIVTGEGETFTNVATVKGSGKEVPTNQVEVETPVIFQTIAGHIFLCEAGSQTSSEVPGGKLEAAGPATIAAQANPLEPVNVPAGGYAMGASAPAGYEFVVCGGTAKVGSKSSATELVTVPSGATGVGIFYVQKEPALAPVPSFTAEKLQKLPSEADYTTAKLTGKAPLTVEYEIVVSNTSQAVVHLTSIGDVNVSGCTTTSPLQPEVKVGESKVVEARCSHTITGEGETFVNVATVESPGIRVTTNTVEAVTPKQEVKAICTISENDSKLIGASGSHRKRFKVSILALGIKQITFYLDGHKIETLTAAQAKNGRFEISINPAKLRFGAHHITLKTSMTNPACANIASAGVFIHPKPPKVTPKFTG